MSQTTHAGSVQRNGLAVPPNYQGSRTFPINRAWSLADLERNVPLSTDTLVDPK